MTNETNQHQLNEPTDRMPIFFIGIGGIGMSAIARYYLHYGYTVGGYDRVSTPITRTLTELGANIIHEDDADAIPVAFRGEETMVVYTPAIPAQNRVRRYYETHGVALHKRSEALGHITSQAYALCVAGTHGKTTTSTLLAHLLKESHVGVNAFLGGLSLNYSSNLLLDDHSPYVVVEADEYDRSFHRLHPYSAVITSCRPDHLDIYHTSEAFVEAFEHFSSLMTTDNPGAQRLLLHEEVTITPRVPKGVIVSRYGADPTCDYYYDKLEYSDGELFFDWHHPDGVFTRMHIGTPVEINVLNATAALAIALDCGCTEEELRSALRTFRGVHRRFERVLVDPEHPVLIDDYAHHPDEIRASLASIHDLYPDQHITVVFQPHLYSRTADFTEEFGQALSLCDDVVLIDIYPAREEPIPGVTAASILPYITSQRKTAIPKEGIVEELRHHPCDVVVTMGAGDIEFEVPKVEAYLRTMAPGHPAQK